MFEKSEALEPLDFVAKVGRRGVLTQLNRWTEFEAIVQKLLKSESPFQKFLGLESMAWAHDARGRGQAALAARGQIDKVAGVSALLRSASHNRTAHIMLRDGQVAAAVAQARLALPDATGREPEFETLQLLAIANALLGRKDESDNALARLTARAEGIPSPKEKRRVRWTRGQIALDRGDTGTAAAEFKAAVDMLPPFGPVTGPPSAIASLLFAAADAFIKAGQDAAAAALLERLQKSHDLVFDTDAYGRSYYLLAQIYERRKDTAKAREQYTKFLDLWRDGDRQRNWVADAEKRLKDLR